MKKWIVILLCLCPLFGYSQLYESVCLQQMGSSLHLNAKCDSTMRDTTLIVEYKRHPVRVDVDSNHVITHIGYRIFPDTLSLFQPNIEQFVERYALSLALPNPNGISAAQQMIDDGVSFSAGTYSDFLNIDLHDSAQTVSLTEAEKNYCLTLYDKGAIKTQFIFPKDVQLIRGKDKTEIDRDLFGRAKWNANRRALAVDSAAVQDIRLLPYAIMKGNSYLSEQLTSNAYVQKKDGRYVLLNAPYVFPKQTLQNIMLYGSDNPINLCMEHHRYGYNKVVDTIPLNVWINAACDDGCTPYWGIEKFNTEVISGAYIWVNESLGYLHVLFVEFPIRTLWGKDDVIRCSLHSYVRMSNVTDLFYEMKHTFK